MGKGPGTGRGMGGCGGGQAGGRSTAGRRKLFGGVDFEKLGERSGATRRQPSGATPDLSSLKERAKQLHEDMSRIQARIRDLESE
jgi:hypothetical protein